MSRVPRLVRCPPRRAAARAFTLIELLATIVILSAVGAVVSNIMMAATNGYIEASTSAQLQGELSMAMDRCVRELRSIDLDSSAADVAPDIDDVTTDSIGWETNQGLRLDGTTLMIEVDGAESTLMTDVAGFVVAVFDEADTAMAVNLSGGACDPIRRIQITMTATRFGVSETVRTKLFLRSTMSGASET